MRPTDRLPVGKGWRTWPALVLGSWWTLLLAGLLIACPRRWRSHALTNRLLDLWAQGWLVATGARVEIEGVQHLQGIGACVVVANHQSNLDTIVLTSTFSGAIRILTKRELFDVPLLGAALRAVGMVEVNRTMPDRAAITAAAADTLAHGIPILVFPEGPTSRDGKLLPFKPGAFHIAIRHGVPVLPVLVTDTRNVWPAKRLKIRSGQVRVVITPPIDTADLVPPDVTALRATVRRRLQGPGRGESGQGTSPLAPEEPPTGPRGARARPRTASPRRERSSDDAAPAASVRRGASGRAVRGHASTSLVPCRSRAAWFDICRSSPTTTTARRRLRAADWKVESSCLSETLLSSSSRSWMSSTARATSGGRSGWASEHREARWKYRPPGGSEEEQAGEALDECEVGDNGQRLRRSGCRHVQGFPERGREVRGVDG